MEQMLKHKEVLSEAIISDLQFYTSEADPHQIYIFHLVGPE